MNPYKYDDNLESERLRTRKLTLEDAVIFSSFFENEEAQKFLPKFFDSAIERTKHLIEKQLERYEENRFGHKAILDKETNEFLGICGLLLQDVDGTFEIEVGYHFLPKYWGKGYAPEAAKLFINYAFENNITDSVISVIDLDNFKSQRVAEKNGLKIEKQIKYLDDEYVYIYRMKKEDWLF
ncbi:MAG: GNAT family N-acetyltransferase [Flavobacteriia bacterium]|jgi:ribosomal-protein-alanine N-acetyltransferase